jgi:energy-coupling factor transporter transmembrane protein EcfT
MKRINIYSLAAILALIIIVSNNIIDFGEKVTSGNWVSLSVIMLVTYGAFRKSKIIKIFA